jgi:hypothetical protein
MASRIRKVLVCPHENLRLRVWREQNGQPPPQYIIPFTDYEVDVLPGD